MLFAFYSCAFLSPNIFLLWIYPDKADLLKLMLAVGFFAIWHTALCPLKLAVTLSLPVFLLLPFVLFFMFNYNEFPTTNVFTIVFDTNPHEALDYLNGRFFMLAGAIGVSILTWSFGLLALRADGLPARTFRQELAA